MLDNKIIAKRLSKYKGHLQANGLVKVQIDGAEGAGDSGRVQEKRPSI
jgi:hypothetical protein